jgi:hypothetical protein
LTQVRANWGDMSSEVPLTMLLRKWLVAVPSLLLLSLAATAAPPAPDKMLNNEGLVVLARAGYNERFLVELIQSQPGRFDTSVEGLVYLAQQGISEKIVRFIIAEQKADERRQAERAAGGADIDEPFPPAAEPARTPVRMKVVKQKVLAPASPMAQPLGANPVIVVEKRMFGDRYYAMPGTQAPMMMPVASPRAPQTRPAITTRVAAFH